MARQTLLKSTLCLLMALVCGVAWAQTSFTFTRGENKAATVTAPEGLTATMDANVDWLTGGAMGSNTGILCPNKNTKDATVESPITFTLTVSGLTPGQEFAAASFTHKAVNSDGDFQGANNETIRHCNLTLTAGGEQVAALTNQNIWVPEGSANYDKVITFEEAFTADAEGNLTLTLTIVKGESNEGCFYGLTKIELHNTEVYTLNFISGAEVVESTTLTYFAGFDVPEDLISGAIPEGYHMLSYKREGTTYTIYVVEGGQNSNGPIVTFTNVQKDGTTTFTLYINENNELATSSSKAADLGDAAKFRAIPKENGKWAFYNESKGLYMIWRGNGGGYNSDKGVLAEYNATYCDWTMNASTNLSGGYYFVSKRSNGTSDGSLVILKAGTFDAFGDSEGWADGYTNVYKIESEEYLATLIDTQGTVLKCTAKGFIPSNASLGNQVWTDGNLTAAINTTFSELPFPVSSIGEAAKLTMISSFKDGGGNYPGAGRFKWYAEGDDVKIQRDASTMTREHLWAIYPSLENGALVYSIKNIATGKYIFTNATFGNSAGSNDKGTVILSDTPTKFSVDNNNSLYYYTNGRNHFLSWGSVNTTSGYLGVHTKTVSAGHNGITNSFHESNYTLPDKEKFVNGDVYTFVTSLGWMGATAESNNVISTARTNVAAEDKSADNPYFQWTVYKSNNGNYYLYNIGKEMFMGVQSTGNASVPFTEKPAGKTLTFKDGNKAGYPILLSTDNKGSVNHSTNFGEGLITWSGGWNDLTDNGNSHQVTLVSQLPAATLQEIANKVEAYDRRLYVTATVEGSWENNPNTHFGSVTVTTSAGTTLKTTLKTNPSVATVDYNGLNETTIDFTREYRGFEFKGYSFGGVDLGESFVLTDEQKASITAENPLVAKFTATEAVTLFYDDDAAPYRIPAIATTSTGRLIAVSDYRHCLDDIGLNRYGKGYRIDLVIRTSDDNGKTWSSIKTIAEGIDDSQADNCAYGDAAIAVVGENVIVMAVAGSVSYGNGSAGSETEPKKTSRLVRIYSDDNGESWEKTDITEEVYGYEGALYPDMYTAFFGSGRLAVDPNFNNSGTARIYGSMLTQGMGNIVIYSDDMGLTWNKLGEGGQVATANEPKIEILPSGQILFSARRNGGRNFNVFTYTNKADNEGTWSNAVNGCDNEGQNGTNGETFLVDAKNARGENVKLLLQSQPVGGGTWDRANVSIWYKEISSAADHNHTPDEIASGWTKGMQVSQQLSAYSAMSLQKDGKIAFFFEEAPCYQDQYKYGYCMVYIPLSIEEITECSYYSANVDPTASTTINISLSDAQGNVYEFTKTSALNAIATTLTTDYPFITLGDNATLESDGESFTYTSTVTLPFKVSNESTTVWHNIYWHGRNDNELVYLYGGDANDGFVAKVAPGSNIPYGNSDYNTAEKTDNMSWAFYHAGNFTFTLKNKLTNKYIKVTSVANGNSQNAKFVEEEATAFEIVTEAAGQNYKGDYSFKATVNDAVGYLCNTSASYGWATHYTSNEHQGGWATIVEAPDFATLFDEVNVVLNMFGDGLGQYSNISTENLAAVTAAKTAMEDAGSVKLNTLNEYKTYASKTEGGTLNLPQSGQFFRVAYDYGNAGRLYMQSTASSVKGLEFTEATGAASIWVFYDNALYSYTEGQCLRETGNDRGLQAVGGKTTATFSASTRVKGKYNLQCDSYVHANANNGKYYTDHCSSNNCVQHDLILEEVTSLPVVISNAQVNFNGATKCVSTLFTPVALEVPVGITAYIGANEDNYLAMEPIEAEEGAEKAIIPANTGVILMADAAKTYDFAISPEAGTAIEAEDNIIAGTVAKTIITPAANTTCYVLAKKDEKVGLYRASLNKNDGKGFLNNACKTYIPVGGGQNAPALVMRFGRGQGTTEIELPTANGQQPTAVYDLQGHRVLNPTKGMYIINGKKVVIK